VAIRPLGVKVARKQAELMELEASRFYARAQAGQRTCRRGIAEQAWDEEKTRADGG